MGPFVNYEVMKFQTRRCSSKLTEMKLAVAFVAVAVVVIAVAQLADGREDYKVSMSYTLFSSTFCLNKGAFTLARFRGRFCTKFAHLVMKKKYFFK
jgi:hypothetical protein